MPRSSRFSGSRFSSFVISIGYRSMPSVDTAVTIANSERRTRDASGFINAVLRKASRQNAPVFRIANDEIGSLALKYSHPRWMAERFVATFGRDDAETLMAADNEAAPTAIRLNLARATREEILARIKNDGLEIAAEGRFPETLILKGSPHLDSESFREGLFHVQSEASQIIARMLAPAPRSDRRRLLRCARWQGDASRGAGRRLTRGPS